WDFVCIQEPYYDTLKNTRVTNHWVLIEPPTQAIEGSPRTRSMIFVNKKIPSDTYSILPIPSADITGINLATPNGDITIINVYNSCTDNQSIEVLR
ncbi:hypothetical protein M408DRAFT_50896, partial [Serendipita vermifera MAFF 305830]